jgi:SAM-dependent methyltransferase
MALDTRVSPKQKNGRPRTFLLDSRLGLALHLLLPNDYVWRLLGPEGRRRIEQGNVHHNTSRADFRDPEQYAGGTFDDSGDRRTSARGALVDEFLDRVQPQAVLEIGSGPGFLTRLIVEHWSVRSYTAIDINPVSIEYLRPRLKAVAARRPGFTFSLVTGTIESVPPSRFDAVIMLSAVHHIPDRVALFSHLGRLLKVNGRVLAIDPAHYALRLYGLTRKLLSPGYLASMAAVARNNRLSTHAMCRLGEYRRVLERTGFVTERTAFWGHPKTIQRLMGLVPLGAVGRWMSQEMALEARSIGRGSRRLQPSTIRKLAWTATGCMIAAAILVVAPGLVRGD